MQSRVFICAEYLVQPYNCVSCGINVAWFSVENTNGDTLEICIQCLVILHHQDLEPFLELVLWFTGVPDPIMDKYEQMHALYKKQVGCDHSVPDLLP